MTSDPHLDPFAATRDAAEKAAELAEARERAMVGDLLKSEAGRWLFRRLFAEFKTEIDRKPCGHNSDDSYHRGRQDLARAQIDLIVKHFGYTGIDTLLKGKE